MRAIIDADHLPTAVRYYSRILREPAQSPQNDISITNLDAEHKVTLESLLKKLQGYASSGETEFLVVLHSDPDGLLLPIGGGFGGKINADKSVLNVIQLASVAFGNLDDSKNPDMAVNAAFLSAWTDFFSNTPNVNTASISAASGIAAQCAAAAKLCQLWINDACKHLATTEKNLRAMAALADSVRDANIQRLEFRSCRLGSGKGLKEVASFFGATSFAPTVRTFYVHQPVQIVKQQASLNRTARGLGPHSRRFTAANRAAGASDDVAFAIQVNRLADAKYSSKMYAINERAAWNWIAGYIWSSMPFFLPVNLPANEVTKAGFPADIVVAGFWTPDTGKPFVFPQEPDYRGFIEGQF
jgi:hypothetical protein